MTKMTARRKTTPPPEDRPYPGPGALFRPKVRTPVTLTLTEGHRAKVVSNMRRLKLSRADFIGLLVDRYADSVELTRDHLARLGRT